MCRGSPVSGTLADMATLLRDVIEGAIATLESLGSLGEEIEDEWTYVTDLEAAQRLRLEAIVERRGDEPASDARNGRWSSPSRKRHS